MSNQTSTMKAPLGGLRLSERRIVLLFGDFIVAFISLILAVYIWGNSMRFIAFNLEFLRARIPLWFYLLPFIWVILLVEIYDLHRASNWRETIRGVIVAALVGIVLYLILFVIYADPPKSYLPRLGVAVFLVLVAGLTLIWRWIYIRIFTSPQWMRRVLIVGGGKTGEIMLNIYNRLNPKPFSIIGIIDDDIEKQDSQICDIPVIGTSEDLVALTQGNNITDLIVCISGQMQGKMFQALLDAQGIGAEITRMPLAYEELLGRVPIQWLEADWILRSFVDQLGTKGFYEMIKRLLDVIGGLIGVGMFVVLLPFISIPIVLDDGFPIFYHQTRAGRNGRLYRIAKFRTMRRDAEANGTPQWAQERDERATRVGLILRRTHLDEIPQFFNVLRGEMSLVGPRAERPELVDMFQHHVPFYRARLLVKPGISGWAQVNFGYASSIEDTVTKLEYDLYYIKHRNVLLDLVILLRTPTTIFGFRGR